MSTPESLSRTDSLELSETTVSSLPMDLISSILSRLPVKSVLRFKSVSKPWYYLIKSHSFIKQHLEYFKLNPNPIFNATLSTLWATGKKHHFQVNLIDALDDPIGINLPFISHTDTYQVLGICNGLVCVLVRNCYTELCIFICNPLTGEFRRIPDMKKSKFFRLPMKDITNTYFGFGLNGDSGYELFKIFFTRHRNGEIVLVGEVYSLTKDSWREIDMKRGNFDDYGNYPVWCYANISVPVFLRGVFYWVIRGSVSGSGLCFSFNVEEEVVNMLLGPTESRYSTCRLTLLNEEVALVIYAGPRRFNIWVLNENERVWTKKLSVQEGYVISVFPQDAASFVRVLGCTGNGQLVVEDLCMQVFKLFLYDMETGEKDTLPYVNLGVILEVFLYTESLVSVSASETHLLV